MWELFLRSLRGNFDRLYNFDSIHPAAGNLAYGGLVAGTDGQSLRLNSIRRQRGQWHAVQVSTTGWDLTGAFKLRRVPWRRSICDPCSTHERQNFRLTARGGGRRKGVAYSLDNSMGHSHC